MRNIRLLIRQYAPILYFYEHPTAIPKLISGLKKPWLNTFINQPTLPLKKLTAIGMKAQEDIWPNCLNFTPSLRQKN